MLQVILLYVLGEIVHLKTQRHNMRHAWHVKRSVLHRTGCALSLTCTELVIVLRANTVAQSFMVDWLSNAPWVSTRSTATCWDSTEFLHGSDTYHLLMDKSEPCQGSLFLWVLSTLLPSGLSTTNTSLQIWIPVVSLSQPPLQVNPVSGSSLPPIQDSPCSRGREGEEVRKERDRWNIYCMLFCIFTTFTTEKRRV